jgi:hypothetical protein
MKNSKIEISFNQIAFENQIKSLSQNVEKYKNLLNAIEKIIGIRELKTLKEVENFICEKSGFKNILLSATLLEVGDEYRFIEANHNKVNLEVLDFDTDEITTKKAILDKVKLEATLFLDECYIEEHNNLVKASEYLNNLKNPNSSNYLNKDYLGKFKINLQALQNSNRI